MLIYKMFVKNCNTLKYLPVCTLCSYPLLIYILVDTTGRWIFSKFAFKLKQTCFTLTTCKTLEPLRGMELEENEESKDRKNIIQLIRKKHRHPLILDLKSHLYHWSEESILHAGKEFEGKKIILIMIDQIQPPLILTFQYKCL